MAELVTVRGLEAPRPDSTATPCGCVKPALETGNLLTEPIGYLESCFSAKNGTPRQPSICSLSRACLKIRKSIFNNPEHSLMGLDQYSHVWILFVFHKNGRLSCKAKVQPPRLNGAKMGVFSTRSPHRPNAIGLTLARLEKVEGGAIYLSGIDMIHGTPVLDIKPYIAAYDSPQCLIEPLGDSQLQDNKHKPGTEFRSGSLSESSDQQSLSGCAEPQTFGNTKEKPKCPEERASEDKHMEHVDIADGRTSSMPGEVAAGFSVESRRDPCISVVEEDIGSCHLEKSSSEDGTSKSARRRPEEPILAGNTVKTQTEALHCPSRATAEAHHSVVPTWVREPPVTTLEVRFTPHAELDLRHLSSDVGQTAFQYFQSAEEAKGAIEAVLSADPRSVYRRKLCQDRLFYFTVDIAHVTCWFGDGFAEVLRVQHASDPVHMTDPVDSLVSLGS